MRKTRLAAAVLAAALAIALVGAATASGANGARAVKPAAVAATTTKRVKIVDFGFSPRRLTISRGTRVRWVNTGAVPHTSTSNTGKWDSGVLAPGDAFSRVFKKAGTFRYHCTIHPTLMRGKIIVE